MNTSLIRRTLSFLYSISTLHPFEVETNYEDNQSAVFRNGSELDDLVESRSEGASGFEVIFSL